MGQGLTQSNCEWTISEADDGQNQTCCKQAGAAVSGRIYLAGCRNDNVASVVLMAGCVSRPQSFPLRRNRDYHCTDIAPLWIFENRR